MAKVIGKGNIWAEVVKDSINLYGDRITTFRLHYPRFIHSEFMTHRMVSKNSSSSRAIPIAKMLETVKETPASPIHWGANQAGMQANSVVEDVHGAKTEWQDCAARAVEAAGDLNDRGLHKQIVNRVTEPFQFMNVVASATDWDNFFWLRYHADAQPEIAELARVMFEARELSTPNVLYAGEWHLPYVDQFRDSEGMLQYCDEDGEEVYSLDEAKKISASCCAQASYRKLDQTLDKAIGLFDRLVGGEPLHASPFEHQATPFSEDEIHVRQEAYDVLVEGLWKVTDSFDDPRGYEAIQAQADIVFYNGNFRGWTQFRKHLKNENMTSEFTGPEQV